MTPNATAAIMFHTVGAGNPEWDWSFLTVPWQLFEGMLVWLRRMRYRTVLLDEYRDIFLAGKLSSERVVALTFDDGYLDNWVYAAPLLERYEACGTVFVSGDFINPGEEARAQWKGDGRSLPPSDGFLNRAELRLLDVKGTLDVQSHAMTHTWYPSGPEVIDFRHPGDSYHWMDWNDMPDAKWQRNQPASRPETWGEPVYVHQKALQGPRYFPNKDLAEELRQFAARQGEDFFNRQDWKQRLRAHMEHVQKNVQPGRQESQEDFKRRIEAELGDSAALLSSLLGKSVNWLCWPGGGYCDMAYVAASRYYSGTTISSSSGKKHTQGLDESGCFRFRRLGPLHTGENSSFRYLNPLTNCLYIEERRTGSKPIRLARGGLTLLGRWGVL